MPRSVAGPEIERLIQLLAKLPGLGPAFGPPRRAASGQEEGRSARSAGEGDGRGGRDRRRLLDLRQHRHRRSLHHLHRPAPRSAHDHRRRGCRRPVGAGTRRRHERALSCAGRRAVAARWHRARRSRHRPAGRPRDRGRHSARSSSRSTPRSRARPPPTTSWTGSPGRRSRFRALPMASRSAANSTILTKARFPPRCASARRSEQEGSVVVKKVLTDIHRYWFGELKSPTDMVPPEKMQMWFRADRRGRQPYPRYLRKVPRGGQGDGVGSVPSVAGGAGRARRPPRSVPPPHISRQRPGLCLRRQGEGHRAKT